MASSIFSIGNCRPIRPVEQTKVWRSGQCPFWPTAFAIRLALRIPVAPVQAFAFPLFTTTARISAERMLFAQNRTGAALIRLVVNVAAAMAGLSGTIRARSGPGFFSPLIPHRTAEARNPLGAVTPPLISVKAKAISVNSLQYLRAG